MILKYAMKFMITCANHDKANREVYLHCWMALYDMRYVNGLRGE